MSQLRTAKFAGRVDMEKRDQRLPPRGRLDPSEGDVRLKGTTVLLPDSSQLSDDPFRDRNDFPPVRLSHACPDHVRMLEGGTGAHPLETHRRTTQLERLQPLVGLPRLPLGDF